MEKSCEFGSTLLNTEPRDTEVHAANDAAPQFPQSTMLAWYEHQQFTGWQDLASNLFQGHRDQLDVGFATRNWTVTSWM
jgi:hypothetical protein